MYSGTTARYLGSGKRPGGPIGVYSAIRAAARYAPYAINAAVSGYKAGQGVKNFYRQITGKNKKATGQLKDEGGITTQHDYRLIRLRKAKRKSYRRKKQIRKKALQIQNAFIPNHRQICAKFDETKMINTNDVQAVSLFEILNVTQLNNIQTDVNQLKIDPDAGYAVEGTNVGYDRKFWLKNCTWELNMSLDHDETAGEGPLYFATRPVILEVYYCRCRRDNRTYPQAYSSITSQPMYGKDGAVVLGDTGDYWQVTPSATLFDCREFTKYWKIVKMKQYVTSPGKTVTLNGTIDYNKVLSMLSWDSMQDVANDGAGVKHKKNLSWAIAVVIRDPNYTTRTDLPFNPVHITGTKTYRFKPLVTNEKPYVYCNDA